ncbi:EAL domain-containing protein [Sphingomonas sp. SUN019]|uniref:putative bifunctional diguanylate cyclase/phosphodiesterase n=1 Tax=Sphingomonas sp. SUN019 TaxID=2937788 RepID=UPI002164BC63|nr:EAL domain-containing protein [Sphingomonas sp. SUN019]UVO50475.1 EAL domain-containing protein [Sphingomonas sp. SUN019]
MTIVIVLAGVCAMASIAVVVMRRRIAALSASLATLRIQAEDYAPRLAQSHAVTGLPTREPLFVRMDEDGVGTLAVLAFRDYDRLCAFDPLLGDRVLIEMAARIGAMLPATRFVAHVDRGHVAIWIGGEPGANELDALVYALGERIVDGAREILPEIALRQLPVDITRTRPPAALARAFAAFSAPAAAATPDGAIDPDEVARDRFQLEQDLRQAVARGELLLHFQPLIDAADARVCGAEALIRWRHPTRGLVPPSRFVPVMEAAGLSHEIGLWALNTALREARGWRLAGLGNLRVAVNISGHQLVGADLRTMVERTLARHSVGPDALEIELTESVAMGDGDSAARLFESLRALGVRIAIDDFGTGFSSFSTLRTLSFDKIKIDREFVTAVHERRDSQAICQSIIALGRGLGACVLAEGVEQPAEYEWLRQHGCQHFQGYYFSPPLPGEDFVAFVRDAARLKRLLAVGPGALRASISERLSA